MKILNFINNKFTPGQQEQWLDNICPSTGEVYSQVVNSTVEDVQQAVAAATQSFETWKNSSLKERADLLLRLAKLIQQNIQSLAEIESKDQGKPLELALKGDLPRAIKNLEFFAEYIHQLADEHFPEEEGDHRIRRSPLGVVASIIPWNLPLYLMTWKLAPALITGNCVVAKPSELTPMSAFKLCELIQEAGFPPGVVNIVHGAGAQVGDALVCHPQVRAISFTGSTQTGTHIYARAAAQATQPNQYPKRVSLEMGGKNPNIIFSDCQFERTLTSTLRSSFTNQGEVCTCSSRVYIQRSLYSKFKEALLSKIPHFPQGAIVSEHHMNKVLSYVQLAQEEGGQILCGGKRRTGAGFFIEPTVIEGLNDHCRVNREEIFGPVITIAPFDTEEEVIQSANTVDYGLSASIHTTDQERANRVAAALDVGMVWVNDWMRRDLRTPFGGVKRSGLGREGGLWALQFYTETKSVYYSKCPSP